MSVLFRCKTEEGFQFKILSELLINNIKSGCFTINKKGIFLRMLDGPRHTLVDLELNADDFLFYQYNRDEEMVIGINLHHFNKMLKSVRKKDYLQMIIYNDDPTELIIKTIPKENSRITTSGIKIQNIHNLVIDLPIGYERSNIISSNVFHKMSKELLNIESTHIKIKSNKYYIDFIADSDGLFSREIRLGNIEESEYDDNVQVEYYGTFSSEQFNRVSKIYGLSSVIKIFSGTIDHPILLTTNVGKIGKFSIYIKSKEIIENELTQ